MTIIPFRNLFGGGDDDHEPRADESQASEQWGGSDAVEQGGAVPQAPIEVVGAPAPSDAAADLGRPAEDVPMAVDPPKGSLSVADLVGFDLPERKVIVPRWMRSRADARAVAEWCLRYAGHAVTFHATRSPVYLLRALVRLLVGTGHAVAAGWGWLRFRQGNQMAYAALVTGDQTAWGSRHREWKEIVHRRAVGSAIGVLVGSVALLITWWALPEGAGDWALALVVTLVVGGLVRLGRPDDDAPIVDRYYATKPGDTFKLRPDMVIEALTSLRIDGMKPSKNQPAEELVELVSPVMIDGPGWRADVDLPRGVTAAQVMEKRPELASALRRPLGTVWPSADPSVHAGRVSLWCGHREISALALPPPYAKPGWTCDIFEPIPFGFDQRGDAVELTLMYANLLIGAKPGAGKALSLDTPIATPDGWTTMGELRNGDQVFDEAGRPCRVVAAHPVRHGRPCYEVEFSDGSVIVADAEHLWAVETRASRLSAYFLAQPKRRDSALSRDQRHRAAVPKVCSTEEMVGSVTCGTDDRLNYSIDVADPLELPAADLPMDPYVLGAWLGDGTSAKAQLTNIDEEVLENIRAAGVQVTPTRDPIVWHLGERHQGHRGLPRGTKGPFTGVLAELGVLGNKHIPAGYLRAAEPQRRALLAGLLDTDGTCTKRGSIVFGVASQRLAEDVRRLVATLGYQSTITSRPARLYGKECGTQWLVWFKTADPVFRLARKAQRQVDTVRASTTRRYIKAIRPVEPVPVRCITVDSPNSLYLAGDQLIATHNTAAVRGIVAAVSLDVTVKLRLADHKGAGDLQMFEPLADVYISGALDEDVEATLNVLRSLERECQKRSKKLGELAKTTDLAPQSKVTRQTASMRSLGLAPIVCVIDECQEVFGHEKHGTEAGKIAERVIRKGRALGIILVPVTQRPDKTSLPTGITANVGRRFCLKVEDQVTNDMILGTSAYKQGIQATTLSPKDEGVGYLKGERDDAIIVRTYYMNNDEATEVAQRALALRKAAGRLTGAALGEGPEVPPMASLIDDLPEAFVGVERMHSVDVIAALQTLRPGVYDDWTVTTFAGAVRDQLGLLTKDVKIDGKTKKGLVRTAVMDAVAARLVDHSPDASPAETLDDDEAV